MPKNTLFPDPPFDELFSLESTIFMCSNWFILSRCQLCAWHTVESWRTMKIPDAGFVVECVQDEVADVSCLLR